MKLSQEVESVSIKKVLCKKCKKSNSIFKK